MKKRLQKISRYTPSIFQAKFEFVDERSLSLSGAHPAEHRFLQALIVALALLMCAYLYFVGMTIFNVIARKEALSDSARLHSSVASLENNYYAMSAALKPQSGERLGLVPVTTTTYVYQPESEASAGTIGRNAL